MGLKNELPYGDADGELHGDQLLIPERVAAARYGGAIRMGDVIERIFARDNLERPVSSPARMLVPPTQQLAGASGLNVHLALFHRRVDISDEDEPERPVWPPRDLHLEFDDNDHVQ